MLFKEVHWLDQANYIDWPIWMWIWIFNQHNRILALPWEVFTCMLDVHKSGVQSADSNKLDELHSCKLWCGLFRKDVVITVCDMNRYNLYILDSILSNSNRKPTRGQYQKRWSCIFRVGSFLDHTIVSSNCTIVWYKCCSGVTIVQCDVTIVVRWQPSTGSIHDYLFCYCPLVGILFEVLRIGFI